MPDTRSNALTLPLVERLPKPDAPAIPDYLQRIYWWAYLHPRAIRFFEREWLVNLILWGNFARLRDAALAGLDGADIRRILQIACVYGDFTPRLAARLTDDASLDVIDVAPIQIDNLRLKLPSKPRIRLDVQDASKLRFADGEFDRTLLFFLLHEQPAEVRRATLAEAIRVTNRGGQIVIVDYHRPHALNPLRYLMRWVLSTLEPFALDLWREEIAAFLPEGFHPSAMTCETCFGGLYQKVVITR